MDATEDVKALAAAVEKMSPRELFLLAAGLCERGHEESAETIAERGVQLLQLRRLFGKAK